MFVVRPSGRTLGALYGLKPALRTFPPSAGPPSSPRFIRLKCYLTFPFASCRGLPLLLGFSRGRRTESSRGAESCKPPETINVSAQGTDGRVYHPGNLKALRESDPGLGDILENVQRSVREMGMEARMYCIPKVAAGQIWVNAWSSRVHGGSADASVIPGKLNARLDPRSAR